MEFAGEDDLRAYYADGHEQDRLSAARGHLEWLRTKEIIETEQDQPLLASHQPVVSHRGLASVARRI